jgi:hypothetical protein
MKVIKSYRPRTTGYRSQNNHINGHIQELCRQTGRDFDDMKKKMKLFAVKRGYPFDITSDGRIEPWSESEINTVQAKCLIDTIHVWAMKNGYALTED